MNSPSPLKPLHLPLAWALLVALATLQTNAPAQPFGFASPAVLNTNAGSDSGADSKLKLATDGSGNWVAAWTSGDDLIGTIGTDSDILVSTSSDGGASWSAPAALNTNAATDSGSDDDVSIATDGLGNWVAVWWSSDTLVGTIGSDDDILVARSTNNGATWTAPVALNSNATSDSGSDFVPYVTTDGLGNWITAWASDETLGGTLGTDNDILYAVSTNNGGSWTAPAALNSDAATDPTSVSDILPHLETDGLGNWVASWQKRVGDQDIYTARSTNNGGSWSTATALNTNASTDSGDDDNAPNVKTDGSGNWVAVWHSDNDFSFTLGTDQDILTARSTDNGATWTAPEALNGNAPGSGQRDVSAIVETDGGGTWIAVWTSQEDLSGTVGTDRDTHVARSTDNGVTWTFPQALDPAAASDSGDDFTPGVKADGAGNWLAYWHTAENIGTIIGTDTDLVVTSSASIPVELTHFVLE